MFKNIFPFITHIIFVLFFGFLSWLLYSFVPQVDSNLYLSVVTFLVGLVAFFLYTKQKIDTKKEIASSIVSEIRFAETKIAEYKRLGVQVSFFIEPILPNNTWAKSHHLFIKDLDVIDEYPVIRDFYNKCELLDKALEMLSSASQLDQKADAMYHGLSRIADEITKGISFNIDQNNIDSLKNLYQHRAKVFVSAFLSDGTTYMPDAPKNAIISILQQIQTVMNTPAGNKLKDIAGLK